MRYLRTYVVLVASIGSLALAAPASATETVQVVDEKTGTQCPALTMTGGGCLVHASGTIALVLDLGFFGEFYESTCLYEFVLRMDSAGAFRVASYERSGGPDPQCSTNAWPCGAWSGTGEEDGVTGVSQYAVQLCYDPAESETNCSGPVAFELVEDATEGLSFDATQDLGHCELDVDLDFESSAATWAAIHVNHP